MTSDVAGLPAPKPRRKVHTRQIICDGYLRDDELWDIEARLVDSKHYEYTETYRGSRQPSESVHDMSIRLTFDNELIVREVSASMPSVPYQSCPQAAANYSGLIGLQVGPGWRKGVNRCVGGTRGCAHLRELLFPMATVAFQTIMGWPENNPPPGKPAVVQRGQIPGERPTFIDGCYAWSASGRVVAELYPAYAKRDDSD